MKATIGHRAQANIEYPMPINTIETQGLTNVNANRANEPRVIITEAITQNTFFPNLSINNPNTGEKAADRMYTIPSTAFACAPEKLYLFVKNILK
jgi:hypothetical protein